MIGKVYTSVIKFYDNNTNMTRLKARPVLIIGDERNNDYTVLPVSSVSKKANLDAEYDIELDPVKYPLLNLNKVSYLRVHKQCTVHKSSVVKKVGELKGSYPELFLEVMGKLEKWNNELLNSCLEQ